MKRDIWPVSYATPAPQPPQTHYGRLSFFFLGGGEGGGVYPIHIGRKKLWRRV